MADIARANNRLQNTNNECTTIQIRLIKIRTFSKSLSICTGILLSSTCNINNLPNYSRVQILCRKTKENVKQYNMLSKIDGIQSNNTIDNKTITTFEEKIRRIQNNSKYYFTLVDQID